MGRWINVYQASSAWIRIDQSESCLQPFFFGSPTHRYSHDSLIIFSWFSHDFLYLCFLPLLRILFLFPLLFFSFFLLLSLLAFSPLLPLLPLFLVLFLSQSSFFSFPFFWRFHSLLINFSEILIKAMRSTSMDFSKKCPERIYFRQVGFQSLKARSVSAAQPICWSDSGRCWVIAFRPGPSRWIYLLFSS